MASYKRAGIQILRGNNDPRPSASVPNQSATMRSLESSFPNPSLNCLSIFEMIPEWGLLYPRHIERQTYSNEPYSVFFSSALCRTTHAIHVKINHMVFSSVRGSNEPKVSSQGRTNCYPLLVSTFEAPAPRERVFFASSQLLVAMSVRFPTRPFTRTSSSSAERHKPDDTHALN